jgi:glucose/arabinose dehydrogenase
MLPDRVTCGPRLGRRFAAAVFALACLQVVQAFAATVPPGFTDSTVASGLASPTSMAIAPDGRIFVAQQGGALRIIKNDVLLPTPFLTLSVNSLGERGLLGIAFDPGFEVNRFVYLYYTTSSAPIHNRVSRVVASLANPDVAQPGETILLELDNLSATNHNGGALRFGVDGKLYIATGENAVGANAQSLSNLLGKILRIYPDGSIPFDNPFYFTALGNNRAIWALGLRNPFTFAIQPGFGRMLINDVGQGSWEEINWGLRGANFGWPNSEGPVGCTGPGFTCPVYSYDHSQGCAITGGVFYSPVDPNFPASYFGKYFFAEFCGDWIKWIDPATPPSDNGATLFASGIASPVDLQVGADGSLYYLARGTGSVGRIRYQAPTIARQPSSQTASIGATATFSVSAKGAALLTYQWQVNHVDIPGANSSTFSLPGVEPGDHGALIRCKVSNEFGIEYSNDALLSVAVGRGRKPPGARRPNSTSP